jgi:formylglycine-generating enzyme required for sulfatase activity
VTRPDIFFSYARTDQERVAPLIEALWEDGRRVFFDEYILAGERVTHVIERALEEARLMVVAVSSASNASKWVGREYQFFAHDKPIDNIIPVLIEPVKPPMFLIELNRVDLSDWQQQPDHQALRKLLDHVRLRLGESPTGDFHRAHARSRADLVRRVRLTRELREPLRELSERMRSADELAGVGDARPGIGIERDKTPDLLWQTIPAGECQVPAADAPSGAVRIRVPDFAIARYPVTRRQFQAFLDAPDHLDPAWWPGVPDPARAAQTAPGAPAGGHRRADAHHDDDNMPMTRVSWHAAMAFCRWLGARLGETLALPDHAQWLRAARGDTDHAYLDSGDYRVGAANLNERIEIPDGTFLDRITPVGIAPQDTSCFGVQDLLGNVHEWCRPAPGAGRRVPYRGGAYNSRPSRARLTLAGELQPEARIETIGFRVVKQL